MTVWLFYERNIRIDELVAVLLQVIWKPAAEKLETESQVIRAITELDELEAIGWVAERYLKNVVDAQDAADSAHREAVNFRSEANSLRESLNLEIAKSINLQEQLDNLRSETAAALGALKQTNQVDRIHLSHDIEVMRGRLISSLQVSIEQLETGLSALNREVPRIQVMTQRAEIVIKSLRSELKELGGEA
jgi:chromosome segregation ATPase